ncbi:hypothetical protein ACO2Q8_02790 [Larkinella sp. VNQ87]|uniref:hypothetical protein n=1 Tax=Larkinella sp. VNQ87 TaxID=3400921 RepID=UPI003C01A54F
MRTSLLILLLFTLGLPFWGTYSLLHVQKFRVKQQVAERLAAGENESRLVLLKLAVSEVKTQLRWEHEREFEYRGQMYDVVETILTGDSVLYRCWWDQEETRLNHHLETLAGYQEEDRQQDEHSTERFPYLQPFLCQELASWSMLAIGWHDRQLAAGRIQTLALTVSLAPALPPPEGSFHMTDF